MWDFLPSIFQGVSDTDVQSALQRFQTLDVEPDANIIEEGDEDPTLCVVHSGELRVSTGDTVLGKAKSGDLIGEMALFAGGIRSATVQTVTPCRLMVLDQPNFEYLRRAGNPVAFNIEVHALEQLTERLRKAGERIGKLAKGTPAEAIAPEPSFFARVASAFGSGGLMSPGRVDGAAVLAKSPLFRGTQPEVLAEAAARFVPVAARRGHFFCTEGEPGEEMYIIADGLVDVVVATGPDRAEHVASLDAGAAFGMCSLVQSDQPRMASCVAKERTVVLTMDKLAWVGSISGGDAVASALRVAMVRALGDQLAYANAELAMHEAQARRGALGHLIRAGAGMEAHGGRVLASDEEELPAYLRGVDQLVILGLGDGLDAGAALVVDDALVAVQDQAGVAGTRLARGMPWEAIDAVLRQAGLVASDVDLIAVAGRITPPLFLRKHPRLRRVARTAFSPALDATVFLQAMLRQSGLGALEADRASEWLEGQVRARGFTPQRVLLVDAHRALAEAAYRSQVRDHVLCITLHPMGDGAALAVHRGRAGQLERTYEQRGFASLHVHLQRCAEAMGLRPLVDDERLWALAAQGRPDPELVRSLSAHLSAAGPRLSRRSYPLPESRSGTGYGALARAEPAIAAASVLENLRAAVCAVVQHHVRAGRCRSVALAGAVFDNPRLCAAVGELPEVEHLWVPPWVGWDALPIGAAVSAAGVAPRPPLDLGLGGGYDPGPLQSALRAGGLRSEPATAQRVAAILAEGHAVARFAGRGGYRPFGAGVRSVLVRADDEAAVGRARARLGLDELAPCGCSVPADTPAADLERVLAPPLFGGVAIRAERLGVPAARTPDGRVHLHRVGSGDPELGAVLTALRDRTGCDGVAVLPLASGERPVVLAPSQAIALWKRTELEALVLGDRLVAPGPHT